VVDALCTLAKTGRSLMCTIHQPSAMVFSKFDQLIFLTSGRLVYAGAANKCVSYFEILNFDPLPARGNPAEYIVKIMSALPLNAVPEDSGGHEGDKSDPYAALSPARHSISSLAMRLSQGNARISAFRDSQLNRDVNPNVLSGNHTSQLYPIFSQDEVESANEGDAERIVEEEEEGTDLEPNTSKKRSSCFSCAPLFQFLNEEVGTAFNSGPLIYVLTMREFHKESRRMIFWSSLWARALLLGILIGGVFWVSCHRFLLIYITDYFLFNVSLSFSSSHPSLIYFPHLYLVVVYFIFL
jgi:hypothetical protein